MKCGVVFTMEQVVPLNVGEAEEKALREAMEGRRQQAKKSKVRAVVVKTILVVSLSRFLLAQEESRVH